MALCRKERQIAGGSNSVEKRDLGIRAKKQVCLPLVEGPVMFPPKTKSNAFPRRAAKNYRK